MRLDLFLKLSRIAPRRSVAKALCDSGIVAVNGSVARASKEIAVGDEITVSRRDRTSVYKVNIVPAGKQVSKEESRELAALIPETPTPGLIP